MLSIVPRARRWAAGRRGPGSDDTASAMIAVGIDTVAWTRIELTMLGSTWRPMSEGPGAQRPGRQDVLLLPGREDQAAGEADVGRRGAQPDGERRVGERRAHGSSRGPMARMRKGNESHASVSRIAIWSIAPR